VADDVQTVQTGIENKGKSKGCFGAVASFGLASPGSASAISGEAFLFFVPVC